MTLKQAAFQPSVTLSMQETGKAILEEGKAGNRMCFQGSPCSRGLAPQRSDLQACSKGLNSQVRTMCHPACSKPYKHISRSAQYCPWGRRLWEYV